MEGRLARRQLGVCIATILLLTVSLAPIAPADSGASTIEVAAGEDIQAAIDAAEPGDTIVLLAGTHAPTDGLIVRTDGLTIQGVGEEATELTGEDLAGNAPHQNGIEIVANDVTVRDLTVSHFPANGVYYHDVTGFLVEEVTAVKNGPYGIYAIRSELGTFRDSLAWGHADSGFYLGEVSACECVIENVVGRDNLIGYSGTGASHIIIRDSVFYNNAAGIVPNVLPNEPELQTNLVIANNVVRDNNNQTASEKWHFSEGVHVPSGMGIVIAGGIDDLVRQNTVTGHELGGIIVSYLFTEPSLNRVIDNFVDNPGPDILWDGGGVNNCFEDNHGPDGVSFNAGLTWNTLGELPDCDTPNAGPPDPVLMTRLVTLLTMNCEPEDVPEPPCHHNHLGGSNYPD